MPLSDWLSVSSVCTIYCPSVPHCVPLTDWLSKFIAEDPDDCAGTTWEYNVLRYESPITYIQAMTLYIRTQDKFNDHTVWSLHMVHVMATSIVDVMKMRTILPRVEIKHSSLAFRASALPLHYIGITMSPPCLCLLV